MIYTLCHKDIQVLNFKIEEDEITDIVNIVNEPHLPVGVFKDYERGVSQRQQFRTWWKNRAIPASRQNLRDALELLGNVTTEQLVTKSLGLSLSDQYWAKPFASDLKSSAFIKVISFLVYSLFITGVSTGFFSRFSAGAISSPALYHLPFIFVL